VSLRLTTFCRPAEHEIDEHDHGGLCYKDDDGTRVTPSTAVILHERGPLTC
jgi:hypothetical protein